MQKIQKKKRQNGQQIQPKQKVLKNILNFKIGEKVSNEILNTILKYGKIKKQKKIIIGNNWYIM